MTKIIEDIASKQIKTIPNFSSGDTVVVSVKVKEGKRERIQAFEGVVVAIKNRGIKFIIYCQKDILWRGC